MTIKTIINNIRLRINDEDRYRWSDEQLLTVTNEAIRFIRNVFTEEMPMMVAETPVTGVVAKGENVVELPNDVIKYVDVRFGGKALHAESIHYITDIEQTGIPEVFVPLNKKTFAVYPVPQEDINYRVVYVGASVELTNEDELPFQSDYQDCVIEYVSMRVSMVDEFDQSLETQLLGEIRSHIRTKLNDYVPREHTVRSYYR